MSAPQASLRARLSAGEPLVGTFSVIGSTDVVELIALAGFDFVILDMEHGPYGLERVRDCVVAAHCRGLPVVVRVPAAEPAQIGGVLDLGADGVLVPQVSSAATARAVVDAARFAPQGGRGANPWVRAAGYGVTPDWFAEANRNVVVMVMIEGLEGLKATDEIVELAGLDAVFLGPVDLSHSMDVPGQPDHPRVLEALEDVARRAASQGVATAVFAPDPERARFWRARGIGAIACGVDTDLIRSGFARAARAARQPAG